MTIEPSAPRGYVAMYCSREHGMYWTDPETWEPRCPMCADSVPDRVPPDWLTRN
jgi:hypothetical protein